LLSQTIPIGDTATFTVVATSARPLSYQWSENGTDIPGANSASYTTPVIELGSGGSTTIGSFQVTVSNSATSLSSNTVTLSAGARAPKAGDLRYLLYQQVDIKGLFESSDFLETESGHGENSIESKIINGIGGPLRLGYMEDCGGPNTECVWQASVNQLPSPMSGLNMYYYSYGFNPSTDTLNSVLQPIIAPNIVIDSIDLEPLDEAFAASYVQTTQTGGFDYEMEVVTPSEIPTTAAKDGSLSRVITAATFDQTGNANLISYGWTGDTTTVYETQTAVVAGADVCSTAMTFANEGYILSAFGGNDTDGYILVGMRVQGDTLPRTVESSAQYAAQDSLVPPYFTMVLYLPNEAPNGCDIVSEL